MTASMTPINEIVARAIFDDRHEERAWDEARRIARDMPDGHAAGNVRDFEGHARAVTEALDEAGFVIVPKEPTEAMSVSGKIVTDYLCTRDDIDRIYRAMIAATQGREG